MQELQSGAVSSCVSGCCTAVCMCVGAGAETRVCMPSWDKFVRNL